MNDKGLTSTSALLFLNSFITTQCCVNTQSNVKNFSFHWKYIQQLSFQGWPLTAHGADWRHMNFVSHEALPMNYWILTLWESLHYYSWHLYVQGLSSPPQCVRLVFSHSCEAEEVIQCWSEQRKPVISYRWSVSFTCVWGGWSGRISLLARFWFFLVFFLQTWLLKSLIGLGAFG